MLPFTVHNKEVIKQIELNLGGGHDRSFFYGMCVKAENDDTFAQMLYNWFYSSPSSGHSTIYLRNEIMPLMKPSVNAKVANFPKYCTCCKKTHGEITYSDWDEFHHTPWVALDSAKPRNPERPA